MGSRIADCKYLLLHSGQSTVGPPAPFTLAHRGAPKIRARTRLGYSCRCRDPCLYADEQCATPVRCRWPASSSASKLCRALPEASWHAADSVVRRSSLGDHDRCPLNHATAQAKRSRTDRCAIATSAHTPASDHLRAQNATNASHARIIARRTCFAAASPCHQPRHASARCSSVL